MTSSDGVAVGQRENPLEIELAYVVYCKDFHTRCPFGIVFKIQWPRFFFLFRLVSVCLCVYLRTDSLFLSQWASRAHTHTRNEGYL